jgi:hypothetical protein
MAFRAVGMNVVLGLCVTGLAEMCLLAVYDEFETIPDQVAAAVAVVVAVGTLWRFLRVGVGVSPAGLKILNIGKDELIPWAAISDIRVEESAAQLGRTAIPYVDLSDARAGEEGVELTWLSGYALRGRNRRVARQTDKLRQHWLNHRTAN